MEYLYITCIGLLIFFSFSLLTKKNKPLSEKIFSFWIVLLLFTVVSFLIYIKGQSRNFPFFITLICDSHVLHGAILYIYVLAFTQPAFGLKRKHLWHFTPMVFLVTAKLYLNYVSGDMHCYKEGGCMEEDNIFVSLTYLYKYLVLGTYIFLTWNEVKQYGASASSPRDQMRHEWVRQIALGVSFLYFGILLLQGGRLIFPEVFWQRMLLGNTLTTLFIFIFLYIGNSYTYLFVSPSRNRFKNLSESFNSANCKQVNQVGEMELLFQKINQYMKEEKPFVKSQLTLRDLSEMTGISSIAISQAVNNLTGKSFTDYINTYRVNLLKEKLVDPANQNYKIMILAEECGFTSKSTLVRIFRQHTGQTPSEYQKKLSLF